MIMVQWDVGDQTLLVESAPDVQGPPGRPAIRECRDVQDLGIFFKCQARPLAQALDVTLLADEPEEMRRIQSLTGVAPRQASLQQAIENLLEAQGRQSALLEAFAGLRQSAGMQSFVSQLAVQGEVPPGLVRE